MKLLIVGAGGREHALAWRLARSSRVEKVFVAPGNGGTAIEPRLENVPLADTDSLIAFARDQHVAFTIVGPEAPLAAGIVDAFEAAGQLIFGPRQAAAQLESSKDYAKAFMFRHGIPTAQYRTFSKVRDAKAYVRTHGAPLVVKADGLAAGKGVVVALTVDEALQAIDHMLGVDGAFGQAGARIVVEDYLDGEEASFIVMCDGRHILPLASSQDHKRLRDGDTGPNTGGMGAYSPAPVVTPLLHQRIMDEIIRPAMDGMSRDGIPYTGFLYAGLMIGPGEDAQRSIKVLEFNCRMGDPETQPIMMRIRNDFATVFEKALNGALDEARIDWDPRPALGVVLAAHGYPESPRTGDPITMPPVDDRHCAVFHAGTAMRDGRLETSGGRVLCVTASGDSIREAQQSAYATADRIHFAGSQFRSDIGWRALAPVAGRT